MKYLHYYNLASRRINQILEKTCLVFILLMTIIVMLQVFFRYVLNYGIVWAEEVAKFLMIWLALLGSAIALYEGIHVSIDFVIDRFPRKKWFKITHHFLALVFSVFLVLSGISFAVFGIRIISPATGISRFWAFLSLPVGGFFMLFQGLNLLLNEFVKPSTEQTDVLILESSGESGEEMG